MDPDPIDGDQVYAAERLLQTRTRRGQQEFLVKWKGWNSKHNTWEPRANILDERLIQEFEQRVGNRAPKRRSVGAPPTSSGGKDLPTLETSAVGFGSSQPKRGRRALPSRARKDDNVSDVTSPSTSMSTRRSSRRSSAAKVSREGSVTGKAKTTETVDSKQPSKSSQEKAQEIGKIEEEKKLEPVTETEPELSTEDEEKHEKEEKKDTAALSEMKTAEAEPVVEQPLEIYVEHTVKTEKLECCTVQEQTQTMGSTSSDAPLENGQQKKAEETINEAEIVGEDAFIITNETDPAATHKIQVYTLSDNGTPNEEKVTPSGSKTKISMKSNLREDEKGDEVVVIKDEGQQQQSGSVVDTVCSSEEIAHATNNGQNTKSAETVVATVTLDEE